jgi:hypothetical protein
MKWKQGLPTFTPEPLWGYSWFHLLLKILPHNWAPLSSKESLDPPLITHGFRVSVVSDVRERVRDFRITFALYVKKIFIIWVCYTERIYNAQNFFLIHQYVQPCLSKNRKYTFYTIKSSLTLAYKLTFQTFIYLSLRRVWRYQRGNQNPYIEEEQTTQWPKEKALKDKQRSTNHTYKTKARVLGTPLKTGGELGCSTGRASSSCSISGTRRVNLDTNPVKSREWGKNREVFTTSGTYPWSFVIQIFHNGQPIMVATVKYSKWWLQHYHFWFFGKQEKKMLWKERE